MILGNNGRIARAVPLFLAGALLAAGAGGCAALVGAGAGGAGAIAYTDRGAKGDVKGDVTAVKKDAQAAFQEMGIQTTEANVKNSGQEQELKGRSGEKEVSVTITSTGKDSAHVEVVAREGTFKWNKDYAKEVLSKIVAKG